MLGKIQHFKELYMTKKILILVAASMLLAPGLPSFSTTAQAAGDAVAGKKLYRRCAACHSTAEGRNGVGPSLFGVFGRKPGAATGYRSSPDLVKYGETGAIWDEETLEAWLENPRSLAPKTRMAVKGPRKPEDRADIIAYLKSLKAE